MNKELGYKTVVFLSSQAIVANVLEHNEDNKTVTINRAMFISPDPKDKSGKSMKLTPLLTLVDNDEPQIYNYSDILTIVKPFDAIINMMTQNFSDIIQPTETTSNVAKLIL